MSETQEPQRPKKKSLIPGQPLPRLWKTEPEPSEEPEEIGADGSRKKALKDEDKAASQTTRQAKSKTIKSIKSKDKKGSTGDGDKKEKKVLVEETPALDTYESRRRARVIMGGLTVVCLLLMVWITYRVFLYDPSELVVTANDPMISLGSPEIRPALDPEARFMFNRARDFAKSGRTGQAIAMLKQVAATYKGTPTAAEAKAALDRPGQNLPLFPSGPTIVAERKPVEPPPTVVPTPAPGPVTSAGPPPAAAPGPVAAAPVQPDPVQPEPARLPPGPGQTALIIPANPTNPAPMPSNVDRADIAKATITPRAMTPRTLPPGFKAKLEAGLHESGWPLLIVGEREGGTMVLVPGGTFTMGSDDGEPQDAPAHTVRLSTFYIDQHEVTDRQFRVFLEEKRRGKTPGKELTYEKVRAQSESAPAAFIDYKDAEAFAIWAGKRLPTEAQWEMAARSTDGRRYPWGDQPVKWSRPREFRQVDPVMSFLEDVSPYGAFDMAGNCMEWVRDWYDPKHFEKMKDKITENPTGPATKGLRSIQRVIKGGSKNWTVSSRQGMDADKRLLYLSFRCSLAVEGPEAAAIITPHPIKPGTPSPGANPPPGGTPPGEVPF